MKIKYVDCPIRDSPDCPGGYIRATDTILIKKGLSKNKARKIIIHEFGHHIIYKIGLPYAITYDLNLYYDIIWVVLFAKFSIKKRNIIWLIEYYARWKP